MISQWNFKKTISLVVLLFSIYFIINANRIYQFSKQSSNKKSDVAIVLGAGTKDRKLSPIFKERVDHSIKLYQEQKIDKIIFTGGFGKGQVTSDSQVAKKYALIKGIPKIDILIEEQSKFTIQNLSEAKKIMDSLELKTALIVSDPLHMKRAISLAKKMDILCNSSPTLTSMYKSRKIKFKFLLYETFFFTLGEIYGRN